MRTTTCRVTAMRDCLISAFTAWVHLVLIGSPAHQPMREPMQPRKLFPGTLLDMPGLLS